MRNMLLGLVAGLVFGGTGAWAYGHYWGEGRDLIATSANLTASSADLAATKEKDKEFKSEDEAMSAQVQQLTARNDELKRQVDELKSSAPPPESASAPASNPMVKMVQDQMAHQQDQKLLLLESRLHLNPEQDAAVKAAMDAEAKRSQEITAKMLAGQKFDPQAMAKELGNSKSVDQTLQDILTPEQKTSYDQMKSDEKTSNAETMATLEMNQVSPMLQLSDAQKDQVYSALYQVQVDSQNPDVIKKMVGNPSDPSSILDATAQAKEDALAKILTPQQLATYHQQAQSQLQMQKTMMQKFAPAAPAVAH